MALLSVSEISRLSLESMVIPNGLFRSVSRMVVTTPSMSIFLILLLSVSAMNRLPLAAATAFGAYSATLRRVTTVPFANIFFIKLWCVLVTYKVPCSSIVTPYGSSSIDESN